MSKEIWLGPVLGNNRERLLARCAEFVGSGQSNRLLYIAASHPLLDLVTEKLLDGKQTRGVWGEFPVYLFRGFVRRILAEAIVSEPRADRGSRAGSPRGVVVASGSGRHFAEYSSTPDDPVATAPGSDTVGLLSRTPIDREELPLRHSLISQIIKQLSAAGKLKAIKPLANRDGVVNTLASLIGEIQRAGKTAEEFARIVESRAVEFEVQSPKSKVQHTTSQIDFDRDVALVYSTYGEALDRFGLTDEDADQLRALQVLRAEENHSIPWLSELDLLVLDGFFDFTPVQGEILNRVIPLVPNLIVNLNHDDRNPDIFRPFQSTIEHLQSVAPFEITASKECETVNEALKPLRERLFNVNEQGSSPTVREGVGAQDPQNAGEPQAQPLGSMPALHLLECSDRELEVRSIAKEIKRLALTGGYKLSDVALVVRERASYVETIARVFADEAIPCNLERRVEATDVPAVRACAKLFQLLKESRDDVRNPKATDLAHLIKSGYFRLSPESLEELNKTFDDEYASLLVSDKQAAATNKLREKLGIGKWRPDDLENVIAYVGSELRTNAWVDRARKLIKVFPSPEAAQSLISGDDADDPAATAADEAPPEDAAAMDRRKKPTPIHPAAIGWSILLMKQLQHLIGAVPEEGTAEELRAKLMVLLDQLQFSKGISRLFNRQAPVDDLPQATLDVRGRESLRRAIAAAVRSFDYAQETVSKALLSERAAPRSEHLRPRIALASFIDEIERSLRAQVLALGVANRDGLRVLEATDVRGLRFRAIFIAGMIEGGFPLRASRDWLYPHDERVRLQKHGIFLEDISADTLLKEEHYFYQAACRATDCLYLTRPLALNDGTETVASYYIEELKRAIAPAEIQFKQVRNDVDSIDLKNASTAGELATVLVRHSEPRSRQPRANNFPPPTAIQLIAKAKNRGCISDSALQRLIIERERNSNRFGRYDGEITDPKLLDLLARHFGPEHVYSASRLSSYGNCAFRFFANRVLRLEPRNEAALDLQAIDAGKLLHDILRRFFEKHRGEYLPSRNRDDLRQELAETAEVVFKEHEAKVPPLNERIWKIDCEIRKLILDQVLLYELRLQEKTNPRGMRPTYFELAFGRVSPGSDPNSTTNHLKFERERNGAREIALIQGQIDRVDVSQDHQTVIAYDYKLSKGARLEDIESGREVQLPIYLAALEQLFLPSLNLGGGGYYTLRARGSRLNQGLYRAMFADCTNITTHKAKLSDDDWQRIRKQVAEHVWQFIDGMRGGSFRVKPALGKTTCKFCDYSAVCRYDGYRIGRKN